MRIITGTAKGRRLKTPKSAKIIRPALSQVREAIFSSLGDLDGLVFLDLFAGTGSLGLEALSRGCERVYFVDSHNESVGLVIDNLKELGFEDRARVFKRNIPSGLGTLKMDPAPDVIFCDPPYDKGLVNASLKALAGQNYVDRVSWLIIEHSPRERPDHPAFATVKLKKFGQTLVSFLKKR